MLLKLGKYGYHWMLSFRHNRQALTLSLFAFVMVYWLLAPRAPDFSNLKSIFPTDSERSGGFLDNKYPALKPLADYYKSVRLARSGLIAADTVGSTDGKPSLIHYREVEGDSSWFYPYIFLALPLWLKRNKDN